MGAKVTLYTRPGCGPCVAMKDALTRAGIVFEVVDVTTSEAGQCRVAELGYKQAPVVDAGTLHWSGVQPAKVQELVALLAEERSLVGA